MERSRWVAVWLVALILASGTARGATYVYTAFPTSGTVTQDWQDTANWLGGAFAPRAANIVVVITNGGGIGVSGYITNLPNTTDYTFSSLTTRLDGASAYIRLNSAGNTAEIVYNMLIDNTDLRFQQSDQSDAWLAMDSNVGGNLTRVTVTNGATLRCAVISPRADKNTSRTQYLSGNGTLAFYGTQLGSMSITNASTELKFEGADGMILQNQSGSGALYLINVYEATNRTFTLNLNGTRNISIHTNGTVNLQFTAGAGVPVDNKAVLKLGNNADATFGEINVTVSGAVKGPDSRLELDLGSNSMMRVRGNLEFRADQAGSNTYFISSGPSILRLEGRSASQLGSFNVNAASNAWGDTSKVQLELGNKVDAGNQLLEVFGNTNASYANMRWGTLVLDRADTNKVVQLYNAYGNSAAPEILDMNNLVVSNATCLALSGQSARVNTNVTIHADLKLTGSGVNTTNVMTWAGPVTALGLACTLNVTNATLRYTYIGTTNDFDLSNSRLNMVDSRLEIDSPSFGFNYLTIGALYTNTLSVITNIGTGNVVIYGTNLNGNTTYGSYVVGNNMEYVVIRPLRSGTFIMIR